VTEDILDEPKFNGQEWVLGAYMRVLAMLNRTKSRDGILRVSQPTLCMLTGRRRGDLAEKRLRLLVHLRLTCAARYADYWLILVPKWAGIQGFSPVDPQRCPEKSPAPKKKKKKIEEKRQESNVEPSDAPSPTVLDLREYFAASLLAQSPDHSVSRKRSWVSWDRDLDRLLRIDCRTPGQVRDMIDWAHAHDFWAANIQSPGKLRAKWDQLAMQRKRDATPHLSPTQAREERGRQAAAAVIRELEGSG
jgi:hypothetical protein